MLTDVEMRQITRKLRRFCDTLDGMIFTPCFALKARRFETEKQYHSIPENETYIPTEPGDVWGGEGVYSWFRSEFEVPAELDGKDLYLRPEMGGYEAMLWVNGQAMGTYATKIVMTGHGNHYCDMICQKAAAGDKVEIALEFYAGHYIIGEQPFETRPHGDFRFAYKTMDVCVKNDLVADFLFDLKVLLGLYEALDDRSFRRADLANMFAKLYKNVWMSPDDVSRERFMEALSKGREIMAVELAKTNNGTAMPHVGLIGHSHMDTAWLWPIKETVKKCARTYSNQLNLMRQYPEYKFVQSSSYHSEMIRENYPELFERIREKVAEGRYEPNGGVWVECDCNITGGESMIRQFLWGQRYTRKHFGYTSDCFWLPDTFGYSAAIPQIMKGCSVDYFLTTKIAWNDTNKFPYDTFWWRGIDGTKVFSHYNKTHVGTGPEELMPLIYDKSNPDVLRRKEVSRNKLVSYGYGDGGGGPQWDQIEQSRRIADLEGCPTTEYTLVGDFMRDLEKTAVEVPVYSGELYLELHRGTLTNQHEIKRNNRLAEIALHNIEAVSVANAVKDGKIASDEAYRDMQNTLLVNQFHDILPGTCINAGNRQSKEEMSALLIEANDLLIKTLGASGEGSVTVYNPSPFEKNDILYLDLPEGVVVAGYTCQRVDTLKGSRLAVKGVKIASHASVVLKLEKGEPSAKTAFVYEGNKLETAFASVEFDSEGAISSFYDKTACRELRGEGYALNTFLVAEDVPTGWDNWDIDADIEMKFEPSAKLLSRKLVDNGPCELRIRSEYRLTDRSSLVQDMIFFADSAEVRFETEMDWQDDHRFLKTAFDTDVFSDFVRQEVQFGYLKRPTTRNDTVEQAKFEVLNHKYTDLSESSYGIAILNDSKYAISAYGGQLRLSLHKGGNRPDHEGDHGKHYCEYSLLPHNGGFSADTVIAPAYNLNYKPVCACGAKELDSLVASSKSNVVVETVKACEDAENAFIIRAYEAEGGRTTAKLSLGFTPKAVCLTNMLEEVQQELNASADIELTFRPFEIKTIKVVY
ncbi:MAG: alpha-mannosidase [Clostridia bacterium]|nr:alpha-mannosidase [Clostridia bacterium]